MARVAAGKVAGDKGEAGRAAVGWVEAISLAPVPPVIVSAQIVDIKNLTWSGSTASIERAQNVERR